MPNPAGVSQRDFSGSRTRASRPEASEEPSIRDIRPEHLRRTEDLLELYRQAIAAGLAQPSEAGRLAFLALAERARAHGKRAGALFYWLLREKKTLFITQADEDAAAARLRELWNGPRAQRQWGGEDEDGADTAPKLSPHEPTEDERFVWACIRVAKQKRIPDPFSIARLQGWTQDRWDSALAGLDGV